MSAASSTAASGAVAVTGSGTGNVAVTESGNKGGQKSYTHPQSGVTILTQNVVATINCHVSLDLMEIATQTRNSEYNPQRFSAVVLRIRQPKTTALIFGSGKIVVAGAKSLEDAQVAARKFCAIIRKVGKPDAKSSDFKVQNIVCSCDCRFAIRLEALALAHGKFSSFEPELFPGLIYRMASPKVVLLIFVSGKVIITGAKEQHHSYEAFAKIYPVLLEFKKS
mmetsp:Transcript_13720/g.26570  ORF Transcript_13720/g.26570 Transcript_13720/m.26570 type:complete len:223 (+) Transcript_13720:169-837(+)